MKVSGPQVVVVVTVLVVKGMLVVMVVADVGAGTGLFTRPIAAAVGPEGKVLAVDITEKFVEHIKKTCREEGLENVRTVLSTPTSAELPPASADLVFTCDTYHHFEFPFKMLASIHQALRPEGRLIVIDRKLASDHARAGQETVVKDGYLPISSKLVDKELAKLD